MPLSRQKWTAGTCLDRFESEPAPPPDSPLSRVNICCNLPRLFRKSIYCRKLSRASVENEYFAVTVSTLSKMKNPLPPDVLEIDPLKPASTVSKLTRRPLLQPFRRSNQIFFNWITDNQRMSLAERKLKILRRWTCQNLECVWKWINFVPLVVAGYQTHKNNLLVLCRSSKPLKMNLP